MRSWDAVAINLQRQKIRRGYGYDSNARIYFMLCPFHFLRCKAASLAASGFARPKPQANALTMLRRRYRTAAPVKPKPMTIIAQLVASGTAAAEEMVSVPLPRNGLSSV